MSDKPVDPANESIQQGRRETDTFAGQKGYGVEFEDGQYRGDAVQNPDEGRSGSYETNNEGGYGNTQPSSGEQNLASMPDPEAGLGQGGQ